MRLTWEFRGRCKLTGVGTLGCYVSTPKQVGFEILYMQISPNANFAAMRTLTVTFTNFDLIKFVNAKELELTTDFLTFPNRDDLAYFGTPERIRVNYPDSLYFLVNSGTLNEEFNIEIKAVISDYTLPSVTGRTNNTVTTLLNRLEGVIE